MKWKVGKQEYFIGKKTVKVFAYFPKVLYFEGERYIVWMEYYNRDLFCEYSRFNRERYVSITKEYPIF